MVATQDRRYLLADPRRTAPTRLPMVALAGLIAPGGLREKAALVR